jgi:hypothetical protein
MGQAQCLLPMQSDTHFVAALLPHSASAQSASVVQGVSQLFSCIVLGAQDEVVPAKFVMHFMAPPQSPSAVQLSPPVAPQATRPQAETITRASFQS